MGPPPHDRTSYAIAPTPPSPSRITSPSPSLSPSNSNSASSAAEPATPPQRTRKHYPDSIGRVPLHRRGTSRTYERLEDLLREAGYKETRIFTPETDKTAQKEDPKSPIGAVVGFLSNLVPSRSASLREDADAVATPTYSPPPSPSVNRTPKPAHATRSTNSSSAISSKRSFAEVQAQDSALQRQQSRDSLASVRPVNRYYQHHPSASRTSTGPMSPPPLPRVHQPTPTRASTYLRHMTSYERPQSTPAASYTRMTDDAEDESILSPTRMPSNWMDNVKRAKEYFAANSGHSLPPITASPVATISPAAAAPLGRSVSVKTRGRLSDRTNSVAPLLTTRLRNGRSKRSESQVSVSRVVCRSRGSSPVRRDAKGKTREVQGDLDLRGRLEFPDDLLRSRSGSAHASAQLLSPPRRRHLDVDSASDVSSEGEDEEITLARILVPSRQQGLNPPAIERSRSVRSLRLCLEKDGQQGVPPVPPLPNYATGGGGSGRWSVSLSWGRVRGEDESRRSSTAEDDEEEPDWVAASGRSSKNSTRQRGGLPAWAS